MADKVRFGVIGCGGAAWVGHLPWIWAHPGAELVAVCDSSPERARTAQERYGARLATTDYHEVLTQRDVDAVCICTPPASHLDLAVAAAENGKHILLEKPMARSVQECDEILRVVRRRGVHLMVGHEKRFNVACERIRDILQEGRLGQVFHLVVHWGTSVKLAPDRLIPDGYRESYEWRWKDKEVGGGILQDHVPHYVDLWRWWTGSEIETVYAEVQNVTRDYLGNTELGLWEDFGTVLMRFANGAVGVFNTGTVGRGLSPILHQGSGIGEWSEFGYLFGTRGQLTFDMPFWDSPEHGRLMIWSLETKQPQDRGWYQVELPDPRRCLGGPRSPVTNESYMFWRQIDHFVQLIRGRVAPRVNGEDGRATIAAVEAVYESQRTAQKVLVNPIAVRSTG